ncbi:MAG TPA: hypothetical protein VH596_01035 [Terriglobales bacterium]
MKTAKTHFETIPVALVKKTANEEESSDGIGIERVTREMPTEKKEPYSVGVAGKFTIER